MNTHFREQESYVHIVELTPDLRKRIEQTIEHLISLLDDYDGDDSAEDDGTAEPLNGWPNSGHFIAKEMATDDDREQDNADYEPSLGWTGSGAHGAPYDADVEVNGDEQEPFCGWTEETDQTNPNSRETDRPQEWSYYGDFDGSGVRVGYDLLVNKLGGRTAIRATPASVWAW